MSTSASLTSPRTDIGSILRTLSTEQAAAALHIRPQSLRAALCRDGHYFGIRPVKSPNRFLLWPADAVERLTAGTSQQQGGAQ